MRNPHVCEMRLGSSDTPTPTVRAPLASLCNCLAAQPRGALMAVLQEPGTVGLMDSRQPCAEAVQLPVSWSRSHKASACAWSVDGRFLLTGWQGGMGMLAVHEIHSPGHVQLMAQQELFFWPKDMAVAGGKAGMVAALAGAAGVVVYSVRKHAAAPPGQRAWHISQQLRLCHIWPACALAMTTDGSTLAAAALGGQLFVWDLQQGLGAPQLELQLQVPSERITSMAFSPDGTRLAAAAWGGSTYLYSQHSSRERHETPEDPALATAKGASAAHAPLEAEMHRTSIDPAQKAADGNSCQLGSAEAKSQGAEPVPSASGVSPHGGQAGEEGVLLGPGRGLAKEPEAVPVAAAHTAAAHTGEAVSRLAGIDHGVRGCGGWILAGSWTAESLLRPHAACTSLLAWVGDAHVAVSMQGSRLEAFQTAHGGLQHVQSSWQQEDGPSGIPPQGTGLSAGPHGIRGIAVAHNAASKEWAAGSKIWVCDSTGQISCCMAALTEQL